jgi:hypothetical protein
MHETNDEKEGKEIIKTVLEDFAQQDIANMDNRQLSDYINGLKEQIGLIENQYLSKILSGISVEGDRKSNDDVEMT